MKKQLIQTAIAAAVSTGIALTMMPAYAASKDLEKCYGVAAVGKNDCGVKNHSCAGQSTINKDPNEWKLVAKGTCKKMGGGLTPAEARAAQGKK